MEATIFGLVIPRSFKPHYLYASIANRILSVPPDVVRPHASWSPWKRSSVILMISASY
jgi:hypothetical protein